MQCPESSDGYYRIRTEKEAYDKGHIPGAAFADLYKELSDPEAGKHAFTIPTMNIGALGVVHPEYFVVVYDQGTGPSSWASRI